MRSIGVVGGIVGGVVGVGGTAMPVVPVTWMVVLAVVAASVTEDVFLTALMMI